MKNFKLTLGTLKHLTECLAKELMNNETLSVDVKVYKPVRSISQNKFQHSIYNEISKYLVKKGRKDWTPEVVKENMKNKFLGWIDKEYIDICTGEVTTRQVLRSSAKLDKGDAYQFTTEIICWAEDIGLTIKIPVISAHHKQQAEQNN